MAGTVEDAMPACGDTRLVVIALSLKRPMPLTPEGLVAEWLRRGLQILAPRFDSGRGLQKIFLFPDSDLLHAALVSA